MTLSQEAFNRQCYQFVELSQQLGDGWYILKAGDRQGDSREEAELESRLILMKDLRRRAPGGHRICSYEYSVIYSESYEVPVMYFSVSDQNGAHLPLAELIISESEDITKIVNQVEHPVLFRPFFMIHPCRTRDFMEPHSRTNPDNYLVSWLSVIGTLIDLQLSHHYGLQRLRGEAVRLLTETDRIR